MIQFGQWSGKNLGWVFTDRCYGYLVTRDYDSAVAIDKTSFTQRARYRYDALRTESLDVGDSGHKSFKCCQG